MNRVRRAGLGDYVAAIFRRGPYQCAWCRRRFRARAQPVQVRPATGAPPAPAERGAAGEPLADDDADPAAAGLVRDHARR